MSLKKVQIVGAYNEDALKTSLIDIDTVRQALRDWSSLKDISKSKLLSLKIVQTRIQEMEGKDSPVKNGTALRAVLSDALEALQPEAGPPQPDDKRWQAYLILSEQYVHGRSPEWIQNQIFVSKGTYFHEQKRALETLTEILIQWEEEVQSRPSVERRAARGSATIETPFLAPPLPGHLRIAQEAPLDELKRALLQSAEGQILALYGLPGVGKTLLATALAHDPQVRDQYRDGILWAGLGKQPDNNSWLDAWADALSIPTGTLTDYPDYHSRAALVQRAIGRRRMLLIVDDVWQSQTGLALKIGGSNCAIFFTTRLPQVAVELAGKHVVHLQELDMDNGLRLLAQFAPEAVEDHPQELRNLVQSVGGLPLALVLMGRYFQIQSHTAQARRVAQALATLQEVQERFTLTQPVSPLEIHPDFSPGTPLSLQTVIGLSDAVLSEEDRAALSSLALFPPKPNTISEEAALAVSAAPVQVLDRLVDAGLVECITPDRYSLHRTIADYANLHPAGPDAVRRMIDYARRMLSVHSNQRGPLDIEFENLLAAVQHGLDNKVYAPLLALVDTLFPYLEYRGLYAVNERILHPLYQMACDNGDLSAQCSLLFQIGDIQVRRGQFKEARNLVKRSLELVTPETPEDLRGSILFQLAISRLYSGVIQPGHEALIEALECTRNTEQRAFLLSAMGWLHQELGNYDQGLDYLEEMAANYPVDPPCRVVGWNHFNFSLIYLLLGDFEQAEAHARECERHYQYVGDRRGMAWLTYHYGRITRKRGRFAEALKSFEAGMKDLEELGDRMGYSFALHNVGMLRRELGDPAVESIFRQAQESFEHSDCKGGIGVCIQSIGLQRWWEGDIAAAQEHFERALAIRREIVFNRGEAVSLAWLGLVYQQQGKFEQALDTARAAVAIARNIRARTTLALTLTWLGRVALDQGLLDEAERAFREANSIREGLGQTHLLAEANAGMAALTWQRGEKEPARKLAAALDGVLAQPGYHDPAWMRQVVRRILT